MKKIYLFLLPLFLATAAIAQNTGQCNPKTFLKHIGYPSQNMYIQGRTMCPSGDGNLFVAIDWHSFGRSPLLMKITPTGEVLWSRRFFWDEYAQFATIISQMLVDSEGMLVITGLEYLGFAIESEDFVCRYDPVQDKVLWVKRYFHNPPTNNNSNAALLEKEVGGNYLLYKILSDYDYQDQKTEFVEINRQTGAVVSARSRQISLMESSRLTDVLAYQGALYAAGTHVQEASVFGGGSILLCKMNLAGTQVLWATTGTGIPDKVAVGDLLIDQDTLVTLSYGEEYSSEGNYVDPRSYVYLQKTTLEGQPVWAQRYEVSGWSSLTAVNIVATPSGYLIFGIGADSVQINSGYDYLIISTNKDGHLQQTCRLPTPVPFHSVILPSGNSSDLFKEQAIAMDGSFYLLSSLEHRQANYNYDFAEAMLLKSDLALTDVDNCPFAPLGSSVVESIVDPAVTPITLTLGPSSATVKFFTMYTAPDSAAVQTTCARCDQPCGPTLSLGPNQEFSTDTTVLLQAGSGFASYLWQNGSTSSSYLAAAGGTYWVEVMDGCGFVQRDTIQLSLSETVCDSKELDCIHWDLLDVKATATGDLRFRVKLTNNCASRLQQVDFQMPNGVIATQPVNQSIYTAPSSGRSYTVRNPNFSPFYSVRFHANSASLNNGASDIFTYDLPGQAAPDYIRTTVKLANGSSYEAHLNTFHCPPAEAGNREKPVVRSQSGILSPNPSDGTLWLNLPDWKNQTVQVRIMNTQGQVLQTVRLAEERNLLLSSRLANGLYYAVVQVENEAPLTLRFVLAR